MKTALEKKQEEIIEIKNDIIDIIISNYGEKLTKHSKIKLDNLNSRTAKLESEIAALKQIKAKITELKEQEPAEEEYYKKVYIKTEDDLPEENGNYIYMIKDINHPALLYYDIESKGKYDYTKQWLKLVDWYLQPCKCDSCNHNLNDPDSKNESKEQENNTNYNPNGYHHETGKNEDCFHPPESKQDTDLHPVDLDQIMEVGKTAFILTGKECY